MLECKLCYSKFETLYGLSTHISRKHLNEITKADYYKKYIDTNFKNNCLTCGNETSLISFIKGFNKYCSVKCSANSNLVKSKTKQTCIEKYGCENPFQNQEIKNKIKQTCLEKYGCENPSSNENIHLKKILTSQKKFGTDYPLQNNDFLLKIKNKFNISFLNKLIIKMKRISNIKPLFSIDEYNGTKQQLYRWQCLKCDNIFYDNIDDGKIPFCNLCYPKSSSLFEFRIEDCFHADITIIKNSRNIIKPLELDFYIPNHNLAIECNGLYWHTEKFGKKNKNYHLNKTELCNEKNIQLLHIFENEWIDPIKQNIWKSIINNKLHKISNKIFARKCEIKNLSSDNVIVNIFLNNNHLQGQCNSLIKLGLYYNNEIVSLMTFGKSRYDKNYEWELLRFCNKINTLVIGGASKLFKYFIENYKPKSIISYADKRYSNGNLYLKLNMQFIENTKPNYYYYKNCQIFNRISFQKHKLQKKLENYDSELTEWENMQLNGYDRIWDCGHLKFIINFPAYL